MYVHFILLANHHAFGQALLTLHMHSEGKRRSNMNEFDFFKEKDFPVIAAVPQVNIYSHGVEEA